jgi:hypothetical protein
MSIDRRAAVPSLRFITGAVIIIATSMLFEDFALSDQVVVYFVCHFTQMGQFSD